MAEVRELQIPVALDEWVTLRAVFPMSETTWRQLLTVLQAMQLALVQPAVVPAAVRCEP